MVQQTRWPSCWHMKKPSSLPELEMAEAAAVVAMEVEEELWCSGKLTGRGRGVP